MKKLLYSALALGSVLGLASCASDTPDKPIQGDGVTFVINLPRDMQTRATFGDQSKVTLNNLQYTVYEVASDGSLSMVMSDSKPGAFAASQTQETLSLPLLKGHTYQVAFYADNASNNFVSYSDGNISVNYTDAASNDKEEDAFIGKSTSFTVTGPVNETVTLTRPFSQLNWGTDDLDAASVAQYLSSLTATVTVSSGLYSSMNVISGEVSDEVTTAVTFPAVAYADFPAETFPVSGYKLIAMNYLLTGKGTIDCSLAFNNGIRSVGVNSAPVNVNYRTNIYGSLLTDPANFNIVINPDWETPDINNHLVSDASDFIAALADPNVPEITVNNNIDLSGATTEQLTFDTPKSINIASGKTIQMGAGNTIVANNGLTLSGGGTITNANTAQLGAGYNKSLIFIKGGALNIDGVTMVNDPSYHYHGDSNQGRPYNSAAISYWPGTTEVNINNANITSGEFVLCGMGRGTNQAVLNISNSTFESTSSVANNGKNWAYAMRLCGSKGVLENCTVKGIQGAVSTDGGIQLSINSGKYYTENSTGQTDAFYALYLTDNSVVTINGGEFSAPNKRTSLDIGGTSCIVSGNNDIGLPDGSVILKGGKLSGKPYNTTSETIYTPAEGYAYSALTGQAPYTWTVIKQ